MFSEKAKAFLISEEGSSMLYQLRMLKQEKKFVGLWRAELSVYVEKHNAHDPEAQMMFNDCLANIASLDLRLAELWTELESKLI